MTNVDYGKKALELDPENRDLQNYYNIQKSMFDRSALTETNKNVDKRAIRTADG